MNTPDFNALAQKIEYLAGLCQHLKEENKRLRLREKHWQEECQQLTERNKTARTKVEAMISHLKALEHES